MARAIGLTVVSLIAVATSTTALSADSDPVTLWTKGYVATSGGKPTGCTLEYNAVAQDHFYKHGGLISVVGNLGFHIAEKDGKSAPFATLKVIVRDVSGDEITPATPAQIHLAASNGQSITGEPTESFSSDIAGGRVQILPVNQALFDVFGEIARTKSLVVGFNRRPGGTDVVVPIDLTIKDRDNKNGSVERSDEMLATFLRCIYDRVSAEADREAHK